MWVVKEGWGKGRRVRWGEVKGRVRGGVRGI